MIISYLWPRKAIIDKLVKDCNDAVNAKVAQIRLYRSLANQSGAKADADFKTKFVAWLKQNPKTYNRTSTKEFEIFPGFKIPVGTGTSGGASLKIDTSF